MKKIIFIDHEPYTKRRKQIFYIDELILNGFSVEVWDISSFLYPNITIVDSIYESYHRIISSIDSFIECLDSCNIQNSIFVVECLPIWNNRRIFSELARRKCISVKIDFFANTTIPEPQSNKFKRLFSNDCLNIIKRQLLNINYRLYKYIFNINEYDYVLSSSSISNRTHKINHPDYDVYRNTVPSRLFPHRYAVFCDNYFPYHPDLRSIFKVDNIPDGKAYQKSLNEFFSYIESKYNIPVVIAAHPKADYKGDEFDGRHIIKYETNNLVLFSDLVIMHSSNSISYVVLADKPIVFITTDGYNSIKRFKIRMSVLASMFNKKVYNIDRHNYNEINMSKINKSARESYIYTYLTSLDTTSKTNLELLIDFFSKF